MDKVTALNFVERLEAHQAAEGAIWQEMREHSDYHMHEDKVIRSIVEQRAKAAALLASASGDLDSFDWVENKDGYFVPREELEA